MKATMMTANIRKHSLVIIGIIFLLFNCIDIPAQAGQEGNKGKKEVRIRENFDFGWQFHLGEERDAMQPLFKPTSWEWRTIQLPHDWSIELDFDPKAGGSSGYLPGGIGLYRKEFDVPLSYKGRQISFVFDGVYHKATIYLNGTKIGYHRYGYTSFEFDVTPHIRFGEKNVLFVHVDHAEESRWYTGSGIYRHVWMQVTAPFHVATWGTYITTPQINSTEATIDITTQVVNSSISSKEITVRQTLFDQEGKIIKQTGRRERWESKFLLAPNDTTCIEQELTLPNPTRWDIDNPYRYTVKTELRDGSRVIDTYTTPIGIREFNFDADKGFSLNGCNLKLQGVCLHQDAGCLGVAVPDRSYERRLQILKAFGCNAIRCSHNPPSPEFLEICDTLGFLVIDEAFDKWKSGYYMEFFDNGWRQDIGDMITRDRNHPSIIAWSIGNEVQEAWDKNNTGVERARMLQDFVHGYEPTRPCILAVQQGFEEQFGGVTDLLGYNYLENRMLRDHTTYPKRKVLVTEAFPYYSGLRTNQVRDYVEYNPWNYVKDNDFVAGSFLWAGVDYIGEASAWPSKGWNSCPFDMCMYEKPCAAYHRTVWQPHVPFLKLMVRDNSLDIAAGKDHWQYPPMCDSWNLPYTDTRVIEVRAVTTCDSVELLAPHWDGSMKSFDKRATADYVDNTIIWNQPYRRGTIIAIGYKDGKEICRDSLITSGRCATAAIAPDRTLLKADGQDLSHIAVTLYDEKGQISQTDNRRITVTVNGAGRLLGLDSGEMRREKSFSGNSLNTYFGRAQAVVQSSRNRGKIEVRIQVEGMEKPLVTTLQVH